MQSLTSRYARWVCAVAVGLAWLSFAGCQGDDDDSHVSNAPKMGCSEAAQALREVAQGLSGDYIGTIQDDGGDVPCRYDGESFELTLELDPESACADRSFCPGETFDCGLSGIVKIDDVTAGQITGRVFQIRGPSAGLSVLLKSSPTSKMGLDLDRLVSSEGRERSRRLGGVGASYVWTWQSDAESADAGATIERCTMTIREIR